MKPGDATLTRAAGFAGWGIRTFDQSPFNHTAIVVDESGTIAEAVGGGFRYGRVRPGDIVVSPPLTDEQRSGVPATVETMIGIPYGYLDVATLGLAQIGLAKGWVKKRIEDPTTLFCSQAVDEVWFLLGFHAFNDRRLPHNVTPGDIGVQSLRQGWPSYTYL